MAPRFLAASVCLICAVSACPQSADEIFRKGTELFERRDLAAARQEFLRLTKTPSYEPKSRYYLGRIALLESKPAEAIAWLEPIALNIPSILDADAQLSRAYLDAGQIERAKLITERALRQAPWQGSLHYRLGRIYQQLGDSEGARKEFAESVRLKSADRESVELLLQCSQSLTSGAAPKAMRIRQELLDNPSLDPDVLVALGLTFTAVGLQAESLEPFRAAAKRDPSFFQAQYNAGLALLKLGRAGEATPYLDAAQRLSPELADANSALALAHVLQAQYANAIPPLEKWRALQPANTRALDMLALAYLRTNAAGRAIPILREAVKFARGDPKPYFLLIEAMNAAEEQIAALEVAEDALKLFPALPQAHLAKAQQLARLGRYRDAGPLFARTIELAPGQIDGLLGLAEVQQKRGDYAASLGTYERALTIDRTNVTASLGTARNMVLTRDISGARAILEAALAAHPDNSQLHYELARVYARLGEKALAAEQTRILQELRASESKTP
ncbi:MAG: tetratricopeptide repeat protein [Bryobacterales bacterium]|nr:tetratricopeptide repeat protein [Bryobacterales bacterium]